MTHRKLGVDRSLTSRMLLELAGCSQAEVAEHLGISNSLLGRWLAGSRPMTAARRKAFTEYLVSRIVDTLV